MKKLLIGISFAAVTALAHGQGTIAFGNSALTRVTACTGQQIRLATAADGFTFGVFYGPSGTTDALRQAPGTFAATIGPVDGIMVNAPSVFALPGTEPGQVVSLQIRGWDTATGGLRAFGQTDIRQVTLGQTAGPGQVIWQTTTGTNPNRFHPLHVGLPSCIPEPSTLSLGALGGLVLLLFRRKSTRK